MDKFWEDKLIKYDGFPPRAWMWAWASYVEKLSYTQKVSANDCIDYLNTHKEEYMEWLYNHKLRFDSHDIGYGFIFYKGVDKAKETLHQHYRKVLLS